MGVLLLNTDGTGIMGVLLLNTDGTGVLGTCEFC